MRKPSPIFLLLVLGALPSFANEELLEEITVTREQETSGTSYWEENRGTQILSGKKNTVTNFKEIPQIQTNNYRQATVKTAGLLVSETPNESSAGLTYRGLGDPHESFNILLLQDGLPIATDMFGYPATYYSPSVPMMSSLQFIRGGGALQHGPQPGGVLNFISRPISKNQPLSGYAGLSYGSYNLLTANDAIYGSRGDHAYAVEYFGRSGDGMQRRNSDFYADHVQIRDHIYRGKNTYKIAFNGYNSDHGIPGGFAKKEGAGLNTFGRDRGKSTSPHDRLQVSRAQLALGVESQLDDSSELHLTLWGSAYRRYSRSQNGAGFGKFPTGTTNTIQTQQFYSFNAEARYLNRYTLFGKEHTFSAGQMTYNVFSPFVQESGKDVDSNHGEVTRRLARSTIVNSLFAENRFVFGRFLLTPGLRVENIRQTIDEEKNTITGARRKDDVTANVPLLGLGMSWDVNDASQVYANVSEAYKPVSFQEAVPLSNTATTISEDIKPSKIITYELGHRGQQENMSWDVSAFYIRYENKFGQVGNNFQNTGAGTNKGIDLAGELRVNQSYSIFANTEFLDARFTRGPLTGGTPQYAPKTITRTGVVYKKDDDLKVALTGVMVGRHYGNDSNGRGPLTTNDYEIPFYTVWDLTADWSVRPNWSVSGGINNLFDREYYSKVRAGGVHWALGRNLYAGLMVKF